MELSTTYPFDLQGPLRYDVRGIRPTCDCSTYLLPHLVSLLSTCQLWGLVDFRCSLPLRLQLLVRVPLWADLGRSEADTA